MNNIGYIYIFTNPSFPYVKIGYTHNVEKRLHELNSAAGLPTAYRSYGTYKTTLELADKILHNIIDSLNPKLRVVDTIKGGKKRTRECYRLSPETAYRILENIAKISGTENNLSRPIRNAAINNKATKKLITKQNNKPAVIPQTIKKTIEPKAKCAPENAVQLRLLEGTY